MPVPFRTRRSRKRAHLRGYVAEILAMLVLVLQAYRIRAWRWRSPYGEIDLIAERRGMVVFVEVKARACAHEALEAVTPRQRKRIAQSASVYLATYPALATHDCRFDVVTVSRRFRLHHHKNAWQIAE